MLGNDVFKVSTLLRSMGITLDDLRGTAVYTGENRTLRRSGFTSLLALEVRNYKYRVGLLQPYYIMNFEMAGRKQHHFSQYTTVKRGDSIQFAHEPGFPLNAWFFFVEGGPFVGAPIKGHIILGSILELLSRETPSCLKVRGMCCPPEKHGQVVPYSPSFLLRLGL